MESQVSRRAFEESDIGRRILFIVSNFGDEEIVECIVKDISPSGKYVKLGSPDSESMGMWRSNDSIKFTYEFLADSPSTKIKDH